VSKTLPTPKTVDSYVEERGGREFTVSVLAPQSRAATAKREERKRRRKRDELHHALRQSVESPSVGEAAQARAAKMLEQSRKRIERDS
jgi:hypothetical protein